MVDRADYSGGQWNIQKEFEECSESVDEQRGERTWKERTQCYSSAGMRRGDATDVFGRLRPRSRSIGTDDFFEDSLMFRRPFFPPFTPRFGFDSRFFDDADIDRHFIRPYWTEQPPRDAQKVGDGVGEVINNDQVFSITIDVTNFAPEELKVNIVDGMLVIEGNHPLREDQYGQIERHFLRKFPLPKDTKPETVVSELSKEGMLTIHSPKVAAESNKTRTIPIFRKD
ncbi:hypothetical protein AB6A40_005590 [Gnathostoma spinigerum]|uniref:SHSP domain-containing protein n=1 Tax=Gnathostoma spinigerum TaxID=75299 RepID=A0ABD6EN71_9BILA